MCCLYLFTVFVRTSIVATAFCAQASQDTKTQTDRQMDRQTDRQAEQYLDDFWRDILGGAADGGHGRLRCLLGQPKVGYLDFVDVIGRRQQQVLQFEVTVDNTSAHTHRLLES